MVYSVQNKSLLVHYLLNYDGNMVFRSWDDGSRKWKIGWQSIESECDVYSKCGPFGICNLKDSPICSCLKGFVPTSVDEWAKGNWSSGCARKKPLNCNITQGIEDGFLRLFQVKVPDYAHFLSDDQDQCRRKCLRNCSCVAYAYPKGIGCMIWNGSLLDLQQLSGDGVEVFIRLDHSELTDHEFN